MEEQAASERSDCQRWRLTFTVDLIGEHGQPSDAAATEKARELYEAFRRAMAPIAHPGVLLPVATVAPHPFPDPGKRS